MAQTRKRRRSKHRGNAAGMVEARGRTGRRPTGAERGDGRAAGRRDRFTQPPTWKGAFQRALLATVIFGVLCVLFFDDLTLVQAFGLTGFMLAMYVPLGYYTDRWIYQRRLRKQQEG